MPRVIISFMPEFRLAPFGHMTVQAGNSDRVVRDVVQLEGGVGSFTKSGIRRRRLDGFSNSDSSVTVAHVPGSHFSTITASAADPRRALAYWAYYEHARVTFEGVWQDT